MTTRRAENLVTQSLLDRLCDTDEWPNTRQASMRLYRDSVKRDVEYLLNTRCPPIENLSLYPKAASSVVNFGLPDLSSYSDTTMDQNALLAAMVQTIRRFEPRIQNVRVIMLRTENLTRSMRFHIEGRIQFDTSVENIEFDTVLDVTRGEYEVK
jgi:type VI secretion system protein ImpF